ncbi:MAG: PH domain-containing protein, partial [Methanobrevibacter sp.]|nr:PH domain-containing protein [Methanobrevibacter sp.]
MLFNNNETRANDRVIYKTKPNMLLGCKKAIFGIVLLIVILSVSPIIIRFMGNLQVYLISHINLPLTRYVAIAFFVVILINVVYIIWQLIGWYSKEYILTDTKIIIKSGVISTKRNYMPYATIQDINT